MAIFELEFNRLEFDEYFKDLHFAIVHHKKITGSWLNTKSFEHLKIYIFIINTNIHEKITVNYE